MAANPTFAVTPSIGAVALNTAMTSRETNSTATQVGTVAPAAGRLIERVWAHTTQDAADSIVTIFLSDGTANYLYAELDLGNPAAASATVPGLHAEVGLGIVLPSGWSIRAGLTAATTSGVVIVGYLGKEF